MNTSRVFAVIVALSVCVVLLASGPLLNGALMRPSSASVYADSMDGLRLYLAINATEVTQGQSVLVKVSEYNTLSAANNVSSAQTWDVAGLRMNSCYSSLYPFGVALFQGRYTSGNVSDARALQIFPVVPCPLFIRYISGYVFSPRSDAAVVLPGTGEPTPMVANATITGFYPSGPVGPQSQPLLLGTYTIVAGDEWGAVAYLYFRVS